MEVPCSRGLPAGLVCGYHDGHLFRGVLAFRAIPGPTGGGHAMKGGRNQVELKQVPSESTTALLRELVSHLRQHRTQLREEWAQRITEARLLTAMTKEEVFAEATSVYDNYVEALETGTFEALQAYARNLSE